MKLLPEPPDDSPRAAEAARWTVRRDRGLSAAEAIEFELWLAADERHALAMERAAGTWARLDRIPEDAATVLVAGRRRRFWRRTLATGSLAAAAAIALVSFQIGRAPTAPPAFAAADAGPRQIALSDGTVVQLNTGGEILEQFTAAERRVHLVRGEAHFTVTKNPARPFVVSVGSLEIRAVGTAFSVKKAAATVEVLVTHGKIALEKEPAAAESATVGPAVVTNDRLRAVVV